MKLSMRVQLETLSCNYEYIRWIISTCKNKTKSKHNAT